ncbi:MAG: SRPBCC family protein [Acidimicrobiales bacterium]
MAAIAFTVSHDFDAPSDVVWDEMTDWTAHGEWIPATRVEIDDGDPRSVGGTFTGYTGYGPLTLVDHMRLTEIEWEEATSTGRCEVAKLGPVLRGRAGFTVSPTSGGSRVDWFEDVTVPYVPSLAAPVVNKLSALGFAMGMKRLAKNIEAKGS